MATVIKDLGAVTAYAYAVEGGYTGTEEEFAALLGNIADDLSQIENLSVTVTTLPAGSSATASYSNGVLALGIPKGDKGDKGDTGATPAFTIGTVTTLAAGNDASASITGTAAAPVLNLGIPKGADGDVSSASMATAYSTSATYAVGDYVWYSGQLYCCTTAISTAESWTAAHWTAVKLAEDVGNLKSAFTQLDVTVNGAISKNYTEGKNLSANSVSHNIIDDADSCISDYITIPTGVTKVDFWYKEPTTTVSNGYQLWFFDSAYSYLEYYGWSGASSSDRTVNVPTNAVYARFSFYKNYVGKLTENSDTPSVIYYEAAQTVDTAGLEQKIGNLSNLETTEKTNLVSSINEVKNSIPEFPINPDDTSFFHISKNMIDPSTCVIDEYVNQESGAFASSSGHNRTDYIEINPSTTYVVRTNAGAFDSNFRYVFYTLAKAYISGAVGSLPDMLLTSPANAKYIVISDTYLPSNMMIAPYVDEDKSFEAFDNVYVKPQFIVAGNADDIILNLPEKVYALVGYELNIYFDNITKNADLYKWDVTCSKGMQLERGYRVTPVAGDVGTYTLTIRASISDNIYKEATISLIISATAVGSVSVIVLGDSTTYNGVMISKMHDNFAADNVSLSTLGTMGTSPNNHEGRSGWTVADYFTKASIVYPAGDPRGTIYNAFYNPTTQTFDAAYYFANSGVSKPDWFCINMGINDVFGYTTDTALLSAMTTILDRYDLMIASIQDASPNTQIGICVTIPPNYSQDAFGKAYNCGQTRDRCKRNNAIWAKALIEKFDNRESDGIYIIPINVNLDTIYNMGLETMPVNARNTSVTYQSPIANGGVHPVESGYWQIADVYTAFLQSHI